MGKNVTVGLCLWRMLLLDFVSECSVGLYHIGSKACIFLSGTYTPQVD